MLSSISRGKHSASEMTYIVLGGALNYSLTLGKYTQDWVILIFNQL